MRTFDYVAYTAEGRRRSGVVVAADEKDAASQISARGLFASEVALRLEAVGGQQSNGSIWAARRIHIDLLSVFARQMAALLQAGLSAEAALSSVQTVARRSPLETLAAQTRAALLEGSPLAEALCRSGAVLPPFFIAAVQAGERSGELPKVFSILADYLETAAGEKAQVASALIYPVFVTVVAIFVSAVLMVTVVPEIMSMFDSSGRELPALTQAMIGTAETLKEHWGTILCILSAIFLFCFVVNRVEALRARRDQMLLLSPIVGRSMQMSAAAQYLRTLSLVINSRLPLPDALQYAAFALNVGCFRREAQAAEEALHRGESLSSALERVSFVHPIARQLLQVGEASARLGPMSERAAVLAETWVRSDRKRVTTLLEPISLILVGSLVLVIVLSVLLPIFDIQAQLGEI